MTTTSTTTPFCVYCAVVVVAVHVVVVTQILGEILQICGAAQQNNVPHKDRAVEKAPGQRNDGGGSGAARARLRNVRRAFGVVFFFFGAAGNLLAGVDVVTTERRAAQSGTFQLHATQNCRNSVCFALGFNGPIA